MIERRDDRVDEGFEVHARVDLAGEGFDDRVLDGLLNAAEIEDVLDRRGGSAILRRVRVGSNRRRKPLERACDRVTCLPFVVYRYSWHSPTLG